MTYEIQQDFEYKGEDWWEWAIWIEASDQELDKIKYVEYTLHPTFVNPVRIKKDRKTKFRLETAGWGTFTVYAKAVLDNGGNVDMEHQLEFEYPAEEAVSKEVEVEVAENKHEAKASTEKAEVAIASEKADEEVDLGENESGIFEYVAKVERDHE